MENYGSLISQKVYEKVIGHVGLLPTFPCMGTRDSRFNAEGLEVHYLINTPNIIHYLVYEEKIIRLSTISRIYCESCIGVCDAI